MAIEIRSFELKEERTILPTPKQFRVERNPNYLASLVTGCFSPILHLPQIVFYTILWPIVVAIFQAIVFIGLSMFAGITGRASGYRTIEYVERKQTQAERQEILNGVLKGTGFRAVPIEKGTFEGTSEEASKP
jgi:hypothetical protein